MKKADTDRAALLKQAIDIAEKILSGNIQPNEGCARIGDINHALDWPEDLAAFGLLAHEQYDHEHIGITAEACIPGIVEECRRLVSRYAGGPVGTSP